MQKAVLFTVLLVQVHKMKHGSYNQARNVPDDLPSFISIIVYLLDVTSAAPVTFCNVFDDSGNK